MELPQCACAATLLVCCRTKPSFRLEWGCRERYTSDAIFMDPIMKVKGTKNVQVGGVVFSACSCFSNRLMHTKWGKSCSLSSEDG